MIFHNNRKESYPSLPLPLPPFPLSSLLPSLPPLSPPLYLPPSPHFLLLFSFPQYPLLSLLLSPPSLVPLSPSSPSLLLSLLLGLKLCLVQRSQFFEVLDELQISCSSQVNNEKSQQRISPLNYTNKNLEAFNHF